MKFYMYVIDSRTQTRYHICGVDKLGNWQLGDNSFLSQRHKELAPMEMTSRQVHLATKQLKDCHSGKFRTVEIEPAK